MMTGASGVVVSFMPPSIRRPVGRRMMRPCASPTLPSSATSRAGSSPSSTCCAPRTSRRIRCTSSSTLPTASPVRSGTTSTLGYTESTGHPLAPARDRGPLLGPRRRRCTGLRRGGGGDLLPRQCAPRARRSRRRHVAGLPEPVRDRQGDRGRGDPPRVARGRRLAARSRPPSRTSDAGDEAHRGECSAQPDRHAAGPRHVRRAGCDRRGGRRLPAHGRGVPVPRVRRRRSAARRRRGDRLVVCPWASCRSRSRWRACGSAGWPPAIASCWRAAPRSRTTRRSARRRRPEILALIGLRARDAVLARSRGIVEANLERLDAFFDAWADRFAWVRPRAGSVGFPRLTVPGVGIDEWSADLVEAEGVLLLPGSQFGFGGNHFRLGFGRTDLPEALDRLERHAARTLR